MKRADLRNWMLVQLLAVALTAALFVLYFHMRDEDGSGFVEDVAMLREINQLDARWELNVIRSRLGVNGSYDALVSPLADLRRLPRELNEHHHGKVQDQERLGAAVNAFTQMLDEKVRLVEGFKSHNSILGNSLAYLPTAAREFGAFTEGGQRDRVASLVNRVVLAVFTMAEIPDERDELKRLLRELERLQPALPPERGGPMQNLLAHVRIVLTESDRVNDLLERITAVPTAARLGAIQAVLSDEQERMREQLTRHQIMLLMLGGALGLVVLYAARRLARSHAIINRFNLTLQQANDTLEERVRERTRELHAMQGRLVAAARQAGMAEVASNVLHNVGNVLNSVSVSAGMALEQLRRTRLSGLGKAVQLLPRAPADLARFLTEDARGRHLPAYLGELARHADEERSHLVEELVQLGSRVDHIKEIVALQQSHAGAACLYEDCALSTVLDEALQISAASLQRHHVTVRKLYEVLPPFQLDRHRVLQILVNLLSNAKRAVAGVVADQRLVSVTLRHGENDTVLIEVSDNGEGMGAEVLSRLFTHGFTTRQDGHGFGLHSSALAAREMGGKLGARSAGPGQGAVFTLQLPLRAAHKENSDAQASQSPHSAH